MSKAVQKRSFGFFGEEILNDLSSDNDAKIIIQGTDSQTGIGKTTLAIQLCRFVDDDWNAKEKAFIDTWEYINAHLNKPKGSALLIDEVEAGADSRRAMSQENIDLSHAWATLRNRNIAAVTTLPTISMLDSRMLELADWWVLVKSRGYAQPYKVKVNDFTHEIQRKPLPNGEHIKFRDLPDGDSDKEHLDKLKDEMLESDGSSYIKKSEHKKRLEKEKKKVEREVRDEWIKNVYQEFDVSQRDLESLDVVDVNHSTIGNVIRNGST